MQPIHMIMIYYWDKKLKKRLHILDADIIKFFKNIDLMSLAQSMDFFTECVPNDCHCACLNDKSLSY